jgi:hypothetical protein
MCATQLCSRHCIDSYGSQCSESMVMIAVTHCSAYLCCMCALEHAVMATEVPPSIG